ncbi:Autophagy protein 7 [Coemansia sp. IMI 203386]|nr:Autophagy protein 7 [Coemansia sp. IMI 203386]
MSRILQFEPFSSNVEPEFWAGLAHHKLHSARLDTTRASVQAGFSGGRRHAVRGSTAGDAVQRVAVPARLRVSQGGAWGSSSTSSSNDGTGAIAHSGVSVTGHLYNTNTIEEFKKYDKGELLRNVGAEILQAIHDGRATKEPGLLWPFVLLSFADLKKYHFYHWFGFPAVTADPPDTFESMTNIGSYVENAAADLDTLRAAYAGYAASKGSGALEGAFLVRYRPGTDCVWRMYPLAEWDSAFEGGNGEDQSETMLAFIDPSSHAARPGWPLRNLLTWMRHVHADISRIRVLCFRDASICLTQSSSSAPASSLVFESIVVDVNITAAADLKADNQVSGWERNERDKLAPRMVNLSSTMDPVRLAESALDLNLQLMRWRLAPSIDLAKIAGTSVLLVGAGTLGAYVARALLAWGVRKMTFIDNGKVSFSNPPRQPLYDFEDTLNGGKPKAAAAADAMRRIFPNVDAQGVQMSIPMPGHSVSPSETEAVRTTVEKLDSLVQTHDVVFLLTDSRESRWLPTMLGTLHRKIVLCVALGFDSFVAMRHGVYSNNDSMHSRLGCYFCNDVVAPTDSLTDRTLDQQCTVTRPGLAPIASGTAVELLTTILQHPLEGLAPAPESHNNSGANDAADTQQGVFGVPEHQIRGYLAGFRQHSIVGQSSDMCTACSPKIIDAYKKHGFDFLLRAFNNTLVSEDAPHVPVSVDANAGGAAEGYSYLETLTGLAALHRQTDDIMADIEWSDTEDADAADDDFEAL